MQPRKILGPPLIQGVNEEIAYKVDFIRWCDLGNPPSAPVVKIYDDTNTDVSGTKLVGVPSIDGFCVVTPAVVDLQDGMTYRMEVLATIDGNIMSAWTPIIGEL